MYCNECCMPMTALDPKEVADPQPSRYVDRWCCAEKECPAQGSVVETMSGFSTGDHVEWVTVTRSGRSIEIKKHNGVVDEFVEGGAMVKVTGKPRRKRMPLAQLRKREDDP